MQLLLAIVQDEDADLLCERLNAQGFRVTRIHTTGGFLARGNVTILTGIEDQRVEDVLSTIRATCQTRRGWVNPMLFGTEATHMPMSVVTPLEVVIGGATVFSFPVKRFARLSGSDSPSAMEEATPCQEARGGVEAMNLILAIVHSDDAESVSRALLAAGHRVTRINTAGAFWRRGNVTLLTGVEAGKVDEVLGLIQAHCRPHEAAVPSETGGPAHGATVFVLESSRFVQI
ncbi:MAG: cyclic-di-AMP receptor [Anaerolineae bacterium]|nr:cyclic-di-AMP receptor [Anaerolineae bacterium]MDW8099770.1 cyclic-di-AMP receptor [Anaerolineae bacterium]